MRVAPRPNIAGVGKELLVCVQRELALEVRARPADRVGHAVGRALFCPVHIGGDDRACRPGLHTLLKLAAAQQYGASSRWMTFAATDRVKARVRDNPSRVNIRLLEVLYCGYLPYFSLRPASASPWRSPSPMRCPAPRRDYAREKPCTAGAFQHLILRARSALPDRRAQRLVRFPVYDVCEHVIYPCYLVPEHEGFLYPSRLPLILRQKSQQSSPRPSVFVRCQ